jgi:hypothetical protein
MAYDENYVPSYRSLRSAIVGVHDANAEASVPGDPLDKKLCQTVVQAVFFLAAYYGHTLTENGIRVVAKDLERFKDEVDEAVNRIDQRQLSASEKINLAKALRLIEGFQSPAATDA